MKVLIMGGMVTFYKMKIELSSRTSVVIKSINPFCKQYHQDLFFLFSNILSGTVHKNKK